MCARPLTLGQYWGENWASPYHRARSLALNQRAKALVPLLISVVLPHLLQGAIGADRQPTQPAL